MKQKMQRGFTLIELIAVMVILAILAAVVIPRITTIQEGAYESNVINMWGAIRNYVSNEALRNAISGGTGLEKYVEPTTTTSSYYINLWIKDYESDKWEQQHTANGGTTANGTDTSPDAIRFKYSPHGGVLKDIYWIEYFPCTTTSAANEGWNFDSFELVAYKDRGASGIDQDDGQFNRADEFEIVGAIEDGP